MAPRSGERPPFIASPLVARNVTSNVGNIAGQIARLIRGNIGPTEGLRQFRAAGGQIRDSRWFSMYRDVGASVARAAAWANLDGRRRPDDSLFAPWQTGRPGLYGYQVQLITFDIDTGATIIREHIVLHDESVTGQSDSRLARRDNQR